MKAAEEASGAAAEAAQSAALSALVAGQGWRRLRTWSVPSCWLSRAGAAKVDNEGKGVKGRLAERPNL